MLPAHFGRRMGTDATAGGDGDMLKYGLMRA
jgi:hypothetical protein